MPALLDTMVLVYAFRPAKESDTPGWRDLRQRSTYLIATEKNYKISAISILEFERGVRPSEQAAWAKAIAGINVAPISAAVALHAGELLRKKQGHQSTCPRCLNAKASIICIKCKSQVSAQSNLNDALIAATADLDESIDTLYSGDKDARRLRDNYGVAYSVALKWTRDMGLEKAVEWCEAVKAENARVKGDR